MNLRQKIAAAEERAETLESGAHYLWMTGHPNWMNAKQRASDERLSLERLLLIEIAH